MTGLISTSGKHKKNGKRTDENLKCYISQYCSINWKGFTLKLVRHIEQKGTVPLNFKHLLLCINVL